MKLDSNKAWTEATGLVKANSDVLWALAGVFFVLPNFLFSVLYPQPEIAPGATPEAIIAQFQATYATAWPLALISILLAMLGTLTVLTLFTDRTRPTVSEAIRIGAGGVLPYLGTQLILIVAFAVFALLVGLLAAAVPLLGIVLVAALLVGFVYVGLRLTLLAPVIAVEGKRNPIEVLQRSWALAKGNVARMLLFFVLLFLAIGIVIGLIMLVIGMILAVAIGGEAARIAGELLRALFGGAAQLYFIAILAAIHRQLSGLSGATTAADTFS